MNDTAQIFGLPLHPLLIHAVVVLLPLAVIALLLAQFWPRARQRLGAVVPVSALVVAALVPVTIAAGESLAALVGPLPAVLEHERYGRMLLPWSLGLALAAVAQWAWFRWGTKALHQAERHALATVGGVSLAVIVVLVAIGNITVLILTGDSGSRSVWGGLMP